MVFGFYSFPGFPGMLKLDMGSFKALLYNFLNHNWRALPHHDLFSFFIHSFLYFLFCENPENDNTNIFDSSMNQPITGTSCKNI